MDKKTAWNQKDFKKAEQAAAVESKTKVSFNSIHYLGQSDIENLDSIRESVIEKLQAVRRVIERFRRDLEQTNVKSNSHRIKYVLGDLYKIQASLSLASGYVTENIDNILVVKPKSEEKKIEETPAEYLANL
ncbi:hypothetical protein H310_12222 [Aphanomyces invadans]|uniref:Uncharacterized protein n=1 Tax=Aphanomyces invadans TaxID=157072 RepID=A0A024TIJ5_9STRA|nr:hypothetical protein H310_12222 [Aphanomyces invadans]ETV93873.1 hypothetical protein H310_12222 [Aphanomyces invadans]|eukprot:XP_008877433.1 hypothetical protein H310_12222 [Aphanomyces invadans]